MRDRIVVGNWKMNPPTAAEATALAGILALRAEVRGVAVGVAPPTVAIAAVAKVLGGSPVDVYAQDVHWEESGAFTGQTSASMLVGIAHGTIVGHSEVRRDQCEDDARVSRKLERAVAAGLRPILCVGESEYHYVAGETHGVLARQIEAAIARVDRATLGELVVAYEPIWAIGTGRPATAAEAARAAATIREVLSRSGLDAERVPIQYGGSVNAANAREFAAADGIDGALVGGASLNADEFAEIVAAFG
ncbi:MAG: triose-phosphate isomerase [Chloroflexota bacterium]|nr:triose-phosphate isomerase [Chloroflexota bacterium]